MALKDKNHPFFLLSNFISHFSGEEPDFDEDDYFDEDETRIIHDQDSLRYWIAIEKFDRVKANNYLRLQESDDDSWRYEPEVLLR